ncbi:transglycosylase SLT domain-containing protein [Pseudomonas sp. PDM19]|uniref:transglycosylase SLT domain-containing protein n=1 Tax=Pseudomonas sp. PDM19 TaxID=2769272 RepID=UPI00178374E6|nr:transglycosylase SLT domain-containing protein [Pseudomonas sp. PDM19]MBD9629353.1 transglycosylase SLT domain-containing protein [Pseudomonas sp. PDM19]
MSTSGRTLRTHTTTTSRGQTTSPTVIPVDTSSRLKEIRKLVNDNNKSEIDTDTIICQIYMESRFNPRAAADSSTAKGLMQLLRAPIRELYRLRELEKPRSQRRAESEIYIEADRYHAGEALWDEAKNIQTGTEYLQILINQQRQRNASTPIEEAYKKYRGLSNGIYYRKIKSAAQLLKSRPNDMKILQDMVN